MMNSLKLEFRANPALWVLAIVAVVVGVFARLKSIGIAPLSYDEYFMAKSVRNIIDTGLPKFGSSGFYLRGILVNFISAGLTGIGLSPETALRLLPALANIAAIPALFLLARKLFGRNGALVAVILFALSAWEIEFSRFGRMYAPIQSIAIWYAFLMHGVVAEGRERWRLGLYALTAVAVFVHESSTFLAALLLLPELLAFRRPRFLTVAAVAAVVLAAVWWNAIDVRGLSGAGPGATTNGAVTASVAQENASTSTAGPTALASGPAPTSNDSLARALADWSPAQSIRRISGKVDLPTPLLVYIPDRTGGLVPLAVSLLAGGWAAWFAFRRDDKGVGPLAGKVAVCAIGVLLVINAFSMALLAFVIGYLAGWFGPPSQWRKSVFIRLTAAWGISLVAWFLFADAIVRSAARPGGPPGTYVLKALFGWPDLIYQLLVVLAPVLPFCLSVGTVLVALAIPSWVSLEPERRKGVTVTAALALLLLALVLVAKTPWVSTRYAFLVWPFFLIFVGGAMATLSGRIVGPANRISGYVIAGSVLIFLAASEDARINRWISVDAPRTVFRTGERKLVVHHYVPRIDHRSPGRFVNENRKPGDRVVLTVLPVDFYLDKPADVFFIDGRNPEARNHRDRATGLEPWSGAEVVNDMRKVTEILRDASIDRGRTTWLIAGTPKFPFDAGMNRYVEGSFGRKRVFTSGDGTLGVYKLGG